MVYGISYLNRQALLDLFVGVICPCLKQGRTTPSNCHFSPSVIMLNGLNPIAVSSSAQVVVILYHSRPRGLVVLGERKHLHRSMTQHMYPVKRHFALKLLQVSHSSNYNDTETNITYRTFILTS